MGFTKYPSIESFGHVWRNNVRMMNGDRVLYHQKIKLHGTNAGIRIENGEVTAQKRSSDVTPEQDNAGFARWVEPNKPVWAEIGKAFGGAAITVHGEWAGPGVQKGDAVSLIPRKMFFIFAVQVDDYMIVDPAEIANAIFTEDCAAMDDVIVLPYLGPSIVIDFSDPQSADVQAENFNKQVEEIGKLDPFIFDMFGIEGPGEGFVMVPAPQGPSGRIHRDEYSSRMFKVKAEHHGAKKAKAASRTVSIPEGAPEFVEMFVTEARCEQALHEACDGVAEKARTADFLKWMGGDVKKESEVELSESGLEWTQVAKLVNNAAVKWYHDRCNKILR